MKKIFLLLCFGFLFATGVQSQDESFGTGFGFGFQLGQIQKDFSLGVNLNSPYFVHDRIAIRLKGNIAWFEHINSILETTWTSYSNLSLGVVGVGGYVGDFARLYGEGGIMMLFPSEDFSSEDSEFGGYGLFGFEFFMQPNMNYYIEIGGVGTGAKADKVVGKPIYSNGLLVNVGFRFLL